MLDVFRAYLDVPRKAYLAGLTHFALEVHNNILPVLIPALIVKLSLNYEQAGQIALVAAMAGTLTQPFFGYLSDRWEPRWVIIGSIAWIGIFNGMIGWLPSFGLLLVFVALAKLGTGAYHPAGAALSRAMAGERRGTSMAVFSVNGNLGYALSPVIASFAIGSQFGLKGTSIFTITAIIFAALFFVFSKHLAAPREAVPETNTSEGAIMAPSHKQGSVLALVLVVLMVAARSWFQGSLNTFLPVFLQTQGMDPVQSGQWFSLLLVSVGIGSMAGGPLSDRIGNTPVVLASMLLISPLFWAFSQVTGPLQLLLLILIGMMLGAGFPVAIVMAQEAWPKGPAFAASLVIGLGWLPSGFGTWFIGRMADNTSLMEALDTLVFVPPIGVLSILLFWLHDRNRKRNSIHP